MPPKSVAEAMQEADALRHRMAIFSFLTDCLQPYQDQDIGVRSTLHAEMCMSPDVPVGAVDEVVNEFYDEMGMINAALQALVDMRVVRKTAPRKRPPAVKKERKRAAK